jgi:hypothetical protein
MGWKIDTTLIDPWFHGLDPDTQELITAALVLLEREGPRVGRPLVDRIRGSRHHNMKELRPGSIGRSEIRILFVFDPQQQAIMLVGGDKSQLWNKWYRRSITQADKLYSEHLRIMKGKIHGN